MQRPEEITPKPIIKKPRKNAPNTNSILQALRDFQQLLGSERIIQNPALLQSFEAACYPIDHQIPALLRPADRSELEACLKIARKHKVPLYPVSRGRNWGYGSAVPAQSHSILVSLEKLNQIRHFDAELGYVRLEPGVTFEQLRNFVEEQRAPFVVRAPGSGPGGSVLGQVLERGILRGSQGDRSRYVNDLEALLGNGTWLRTGNKAIAPGEKIEFTNTGSDLTPLFFQSNLGIITEMGLFLPPKPEVQRAFLATCPEKGLPALIDQLRRLFQQDILTGGCALYNGWRMQSMKSAAFKGLLADWCLSGAIASAESLSLEGKKRQLVEQVNDYTTTLDFGRINGENPFFGREFYDNLSLLYDHSYAVNNVSPPRDGKGLRWQTAIIPFKGEAVLQAVSMALRVCSMQDVIPSLSLQIVDPYVVYLIAAFPYPMADAVRTKRIAETAQALFEQWKSAGYLPYRLGINHYPMQSTDQSAHQAMIQQIKKLFDPDRIIAPGRYES